MRMLNLLLRIVGGAGIGISLKKIYDKYIGHENNKKASCIKKISDRNSDTFNFNNENDLAVQASSEMFYLSSIKALLEEYNININELGAFDILCNKIERRVQISLLKSLSAQKTVDALLNTYQTESIKPFDIEIEYGSSGTYILDSHLTDIIKKIDLAERRDSCIEKAKLILTAYYAKGIEEVISNFGKEFEELEQLRKSEDTSIQDYYIDLKEDLGFHLKILSQ
ncbi:MAG: hypothetical protein D3910_12515 [Candidatus Electrothrix sp. ATG2]|nr:hypothetical protein [Candidatus Electrothrix sp. ATG2]